MGIKLETLMLGVGPIVALSYKELKRKIVLKKELERTIEKKDKVLEMAKTESRKAKKIITRLVAPD